MVRQVFVHPEGKWPLRPPLTGNRSLDVREEVGHGKGWKGAVGNKHTPPLRIAIGQKPQRQEEEGEEWIWHPTPETERREGGITVSSSWEHVRGFREGCWIGDRGLAPMALFDIWSWHGLRHFSFTRKEHQEKCWACRIWAQNKTIEHLVVVTYLKQDASSIMAPIYCLVWPIFILFKGLPTKLCQHVTRKETAAICVETHSSYGHVLHQDVTLVQFKISWGIICQG